jgi:phthiocerol/phenolphthiocerol synthesis type-I polyketide synthase E
MSNPTEKTDQLQGVAIVGMAGRFPGATNVEAFWKNLEKGVESISAFSEDQLLETGIDPELLTSAAYVKASAVLGDVELFDADFFGFTPREAEVTDPQHRIFLECAWEALENAGYDPGQFDGRIGVFAGAGLHCYYQHHIAANPRLLKLLGELPRFIAIEKDFLSTRVSYRLNLKGPSISLQTACSTSLVAVHLGCQSLLNGDSDMVLAGGVSIKLPQASGYLYQEGSILSSDGHCRAFDAAASGTVFGSGAAIVVLKRLAEAVADGDRVYAVILGSAINNDGAIKVGYTAPSVEGQATVIAEAIAMAGITGDDVSYVETHGTGTKLGDPIEIAALSQAFRTTTDRKQFCAVGSLKTNVGHLDAAAGVAGLIKVALALQNQKLPPSLHFKDPNPCIDFVASPFFVQKALTNWNPANGRRIAGVSSFGIGGTNAHVVVEEPSAISNESPARTWQILPLSAKSPMALESATKRLAECLKSHRELNLADVAFTLQHGRRAFAHRRILAAETIDNAIQLLEGKPQYRVYSGTAAEEGVSVAFMFPAQGAQHANMGRDLYEHEPVFQAEVDRCATYLEPVLGVDLRKILYPSDCNLKESNELLRQTSMTQPAVFVVSYALARLWMSWGIKPAAVIGHSLGEYVAATVAGIFDLDGALALVAERARLMQQLPCGSMLAVYLDESALRPWLNEELSLAAVNAPGLTVLSGKSNLVEQLAAKLREAGVEVQPLLTSHAFHSVMMEPIIAEFVQQIHHTKRRAPEIPLVSTLTGNWITREQVADPNYWGQQTRSGVRFSPAIQELLKMRSCSLLEVGPGNSLSTLAKLHLPRTDHYRVVNTLPHAKEDRSAVDSVMTALGRLWVTGVPIDWKQLQGKERRRRVSLPTYPFERKRFWIDAPKIEPTEVAASRATFTNTSAVAPVDSIAVTDSEPVVVSNAASVRPELKTRYVAPVSELERTLAQLWQEVLGLNQIGIHDNFFDLGGQSLIAVALVSELGRVFGMRFSPASLIDSPTIHLFSEAILRQRSNDNSTDSSKQAVIERQIRGFIIETFLSGDERALSNSDSFLDGQIMDGMGFLQVAAFLEETYRLSVKDDELTRSNMDSIENISAYVRQKLEGMAKTGKVSVLSPARQEVAVEVCMSEASSVSAPPMLQPPQSAI